MFWVSNDVMTTLEITGPPGGFGEPALCICSALGLSICPSSTASAQASLICLPWVFLGLVALAGGLQKPCLETRDGEQYHGFWLRWIVLCRWGAGITESCT